MAKKAATKAAKAEAEAKAKAEASAERAAKQAAAVKAREDEQAAEALADAPGAAERNLRDKHGMNPSQAHHFVRGCSDDQVRALAVAKDRGELRAALDAIADGKGSEVRGQGSGSGQGTGDS